MRAHREYPGYRNAWRREAAVRNQRTDPLWGAGETDSRVCLTIWLAIFPHLPHWEATPRQSRTWRSERAPSDTRERIWWSVTLLQTQTYMVGYGSVSDSLFVNRKVMQMRMIVKKI